MQKKTPKPQPKKKPAPKATKPAATKRRTAMFEHEKKDNEKPAATQGANPPRAKSGQDAGNAAIAYREQVEPSPTPPTRSETVDALEKEADAQAQFNQKQADEQAKQVADFEQAQQKAMLETQTDADKAREDAEQAYEASIDPKKKQAALKGEMDARKKRDEEQAKAAK